MEWIKLFSRKWLYGSGRNMTPEKRGVWADLLALAAESKFRDGSLRFDTDQPMPRDYIAAILRIDKQLLDVCLTAFQADVNMDNGKGRIELWEDGTIYLTNFAEYQEGGKKKQEEPPQTNLTGEYVPPNDELEDKSEAEIHYYTANGYWPKDAYKHRRLR